MKGLTRIVIAPIALMVAALALPGCKADRIDPAMIKFFYNAETKFADSFNDTALCNLYTDDATVTIIIDSHGIAAPQTTQMNKSQICDFVHSSSEAAKSQGLKSNTTLHVDSQQIAPDGKTAHITAALVESVRLPNGRTLTKESTVNEWLLLDHGKLRITKTEQWYP